MCDSGLLAVPQSPGGAGRRAAVEAAEIRKSSSTPETSQLPTPRPGAAAEAQEVMRKGSSGLTRPVC